MRLYLTRHGQTEWSLKNIICGSTDCDLTVQGVEQAKELAERVKTLGVDIIYSSTLKRSRQTAEVIAQALQVPIVSDERLVEQCYGEFEGRSRDDKEFKSYWKQFPSRMKGGDSVLQLVQRVYNCLDDIKAEYNDKVVLLVGHGGMCKVVHSYFNDLSNEEFYGFNMQNCALEEYEI